MPLRHLRHRRSRCLGAIWHLPSGRRSRSRLHRTLEWREIARRLGRAASTVSRELRRNAATRSGGLEYRASTGNGTLSGRHVDQSVQNLRSTRAAAYVQDRLAGQVVARTSCGSRADRAVEGTPAWPRQKRRWGMAWSPEQIAQRLRHDFPGDETMQISHEAIYQALYVQARGGLRRELTACLRTGRALRVPRARARGRGKAFISPRVMISERPAEADESFTPTRARARGTRSARPVRRHAVNSRRSPPRPCTYSAW